MTSNDDDFDAERPDDAVETEYLGSYDSLDEFLRIAVDTLVRPEGEWLLDCLDLVRVRSALESGGHYRLRERDGLVFRDTLRRRG